MARTNGASALAVDRRLLLSVLATVLVVGTAAGSEWRKAEIQEDFGQNRLSPGLWSVHRVGAQVDATGGRLRLVIPEGPEGRPPVGIQGLFRIEGDFAVQADYAIVSMPMPTKNWINVEILIAGPAGAAAVMRTNHAKEGSGYSLWYEPADKNASGAWKQIRTKDRSGTLRLERIGENLRFLVATGTEKEFRELGSVAYGTSPITDTFFRVVLPETDSPTEIAFDNIHIEADTVARPSDPANSTFGRRAWLGAAFLAVCLGMVALWYRGIVRKKRARP